MIDSENKMIRVREVMKQEFDMIDGRVTVMEALRTMKHVETKSLIVDKRHDNDLWLLKLCNRANLIWIFKGVVISPITRQ